MIEVIQSWLNSGQAVAVAGMILRPRAGGDTALTPVVIESRDAFVCFLIDDNANGWVLKRFCPGCEPDANYLEAIETLVPRKPGFESGFGRRVVKISSISPDGYCTQEFQNSLNGAVLMPQVISPTWAELLDSIREGSRSLSRVERLLLCQKLSQAVDWLESTGIAHRDLSDGNVMIDPINIEVHLVDWDGLYHRGLAMPANTSCGSRGYLAPFVKLNGPAEGDLTWRDKADRFALAALNSELLLMREGLPRVGGHGLFDQDDINNRSGKTVIEVRNGLRYTFPAASQLLEAALTARSFEECPGPLDWIDFATRQLDNNSESIWGEGASPDEETQSIYDAPYQPHFVEINRTAFVQLNREAFVRLLQRRRH
jgi:serine/threonine protein kinase